MKVLDLFSGIGGFSLGLERAGFETVAFCEIDPFCRKVLKKHWPDVPIYEDIRTLNGKEIGSVDVITGGYPCQPFSTAGKRRGQEDDRHLWPEMLRLIQEIKPTWVIGENVAGHISMGLDTVLSDLESEAYRTRTFVIPACSIDARHRRDRVWIVANTDVGASRPRIEPEPVQEKQFQSSPGSTNKTDVANTDRDNAQRIKSSEPEKEIRQEPRERQAGSCGDGVRRWPSEPSVGRVAHGIPNRVDRLKSLGNSVVPQIPEIIGRAILNV